MITQEIVRQLFIYCEDDGWAGLQWRKRMRNWIPAGARAGSMTAKGYREVKVMRRQYPEHRLIWLYHFGDLPEEIDHINLNRADNRVGNLRPCSRSENLRNRRKYRSNKSGFKGVLYYPNRRSPWIAQIGHNGRTRYLGSFSSSDEARAAYAIAAKNLHGEFARTC